MIAPMADLDVLEAIHTARAVRRFKPDAVPEALITQILDAAIRAPSAGRNRLIDALRCGLIQA